MLRNIDERELKAKLNELLNEVLSLNAQECQLTCNPIADIDFSSMKS